MIVSLFKSIYLIRSYKVWSYTDTGHQGPDHHFKDYLAVETGNYISVMYNLTLLDPQPIKSKPIHQQSKPVTNHSNPVMKRGKQQPIRIMHWSNKRARDGLISNKTPLYTYACHRCLFSAGAYINNAIKCSKCWLHALACCLQSLCGATRQSGYLISLTYK